MGDPKREMCVFVIRLGLDSFEVSPKPPPFVSGRIWLELGGRSFPGYDWSDMPLSVVGSLGEAIRYARSGETADFYFFEGAYFVKVSPEGRGSAGPVVRVSGVHDRLHAIVEAEGGVFEAETVGVVEAETVVSLADLEDVYVRCVQDLRAWADEHGHAEITALLAQQYSL